MKEVGTKTAYMRGSDRERTLLAEASGALTRRLVDWSELTSADFALWDELLRRTEAAPDLSPDWACSLIEAHEIPPSQIRVLIVAADGRAHTIVPLRIRSERWYALPIRSVQPLNSVFSLHLDVLTDLDPAAAVAQVVALLDEDLGGWSVIHLNGLIDDSELLSAVIEAARERRWPIDRRSGSTPPFLEIESDWESFLRGKSANFRSNLKRKARKIHETGRVAIQFITEPDGVAAALQHIDAIERGSWKASAGTAITSRQWEQRFYAALSERFGRRGQLLVTLLTLDDKPVAHDVTLLGGGRAYCLKTSFDGAFAELSPGTVLRGELMQRMFRAGVKEYDFLGNNERYKLEWSETVRRHVSISLFNSACLAGRVLAIRHRLRGKAGAAVQ